MGTNADPLPDPAEPRRGTVSVAVEPSGQVVLTAPPVTPIERLDRVVRQKARWIVERTRRTGDLRRPAEREFISGETFMYLGKHFRLRVESAVNPRPARLLRGWLVVTTARHLTGPARSRDVRKQLVQWYRAHALDHVRDRSLCWSAMLRMRPRDVLVRDPQRRWGSCDASGALRFSWRIVQAPSRPHRLRRRPRTGPPSPQNPHAPVLVRTRSLHP